MCDTIVAVGSASEEGFTLFGKNSDREPDEAQNILIVPPKKHDLKATVQCTYLTIPQVQETARVLLCQPCISPFFPVFSPDTTIPGEYREGSENYNSKSYWWESERFHRKALLNFNSAQIEIQPLIMNYEEEIISSIENSLNTLNQKQIDECFIRAQTMVKNWGSKLNRLPSVNLGWRFCNYWRRYNKMNGIP